VRTTMVATRLMMVSVESINQRGVARLRR